MKSWMMAGIAAAVLIGALLPLQALINARLGSLTNGALYAAFVSFLVGTTLLGAMLVATRTPLLPAGGVSGLPLWIWTGGAIGALFVFSATLLVPRLGAASMICLVVLGQVLASLLLDHYGVLAPKRPADLMRLFGAVLVVVGVALVVRPWQAR
jgi:transporter family-2 protein